MNKGKLLRMAVAILLVFGPIFATVAAIAPTPASAQPAQPGSQTGNELPVPTVPSNPEDAPKIANNLIGLLTSWILIPALSLFTLVTIIWLMALAFGGLELKVKAKKHIVWLVVAFAGMIFCGLGYGLVLAFGRQALK